MTAKPRTTSSQIPHTTPSRAIANPQRLLANPPLSDQATTSLYRNLLCKTTCNILANLLELEASVSTLCGKGFLSSLGPHTIRQICGPHVPSSEFSPKRLSLVFGSQRRMSSEGIKTALTKCPGAFSCALGSHQLVEMSFKPLTTAPVPAAQATSTPWDPALLAELIKLLNDSSPAVRRLHFPSIPSSVNSH